MSPNTSLQRSGEVPVMCTYTCDLDPAQESTRDQPGWSETITVVVISVCDERGREYGPDDWPDEVRARWERAIEAEVRGEMADRRDAARIDEAERLAA